MNAGTFELDLAGNRCLSSADKSIRHAAPSLAYPRQPIGYVTDVCPPGFRTTDRVSQSLRALIGA